MAFSFLLLVLINIDVISKIILQNSTETENNFRESIRISSSFFLFSVIILFVNRIGNYIIHKYDNLAVNLYLIILLIVSLLQYLLFVSHTAFEWTTTQDIPLLLRMLDPDYLKNDFYTNAAINAPRHGFRWLISVPIILGLDWYKAIYLCKVIVYIIYKPLMFLAMYTVVNGWRPLKGAQKESVKFILFIFVTFELFHLQGGSNLAGWGPVYANVFSPMDLSLIISLFYLILINLKSIKCQIISVIFLAFSTFIHPVMGMGMFVVKNIFTFPLLNTKLYLTKEIAPFIVGVLLPIILMKINYQVTNILNANEFVEYVIVNRHPHHYLMSSVLGARFVWWMIVLIIPLIAAIIMKNRSLIILSFSVIISFIFPVFLQYFGTEIMPQKIIAELGPSRFTCFTSLIWVLEIIILATVFHNENIISSDTSNVYNCENSV